MQPEPLSQSRRAARPFSRRGVLLDALESRAYMAAISFGSPTQLVTQGIGTASIGVDLNGDTFPDIVAVNTSTNSLTVFLNQSGGTFAPGVALATAGRPTSVVSGDFNLDGKIDLAVAQANAGTIGVFIGSGTGTFGARQDYLYDNVTPGGTNIDRVAIADLNGDLISDLVVSSAGAAHLVTLLGNGNGSFVNVATSSIVLPGPIVVADFNGDGPPDVATISGNSASIQIFFGLGNGAFGTPSTNPVGTAGDITTGGLVKGDFNRDSILDLAATVHTGTQDQVAVLVGKGAGIFDTTVLNSVVPTGSTTLANVDFDANGKPDLLVGQTTPAGTSDVITGLGTGRFGAALGLNLSTGTWTTIAAADFNNDKRVDVFSTSGTTATGNLLLNTTGVIVKTPTATAISTSANPIDFGQSVTFDAIVAAGDLIPTGRVTFFDGSKALGTVKLDSTGHASLTTAHLQPGQHAIKAKYLGTTHLAVSVSDAVSQSVVATPTNLSLNLKKVTLPAVVIPGDVGSATFGLTNLGGTTGNGKVSIELFASADGVIDESDTSLPSTKLTDVKVKLAAGKKAVLSGKFTIPQNLPAGTYQILARAVAGDGLAGADVDSTALNLKSVQHVWAFGDVGTRHRVKLSVLGTDGTKVTYSLTGPGSGFVSTLDSTNVGVTMIGTTVASSLAIAVRGGAKLMSLASLVAFSSLGSISAAKSNLNGTLHIAGDAKNLTLNDISIAAVAIDGTRTISLTASNVVDTTLQTNSAMNNFRVASWTATNIVRSRIDATWIGALNVKSSFAGSIHLNGTSATGGVSLRSLRVVGDLSLGKSTVAGSIGSISAGGAISGSLSANGKINSLTAGSISADVGANKFGLVHVRGDVTGARVLAGASFGSDGALNGVGDVFASGIISTLRVGGAISSSLIAAGLDPVDGVFLNGNDLLLGESSIGAVSVSGNIDSGSKILSSKLPKKVSVAGQKFDPASNAAFSLS